MSAWLESLPRIGLPIGAICWVVLYVTRKSIFPLAIFLIGIPALTWPVEGSVALAIYAVAIPVAVGLSHFFTTRILNPGAADNSG